MTGQDHTASTLPAGEVDLAAVLSFLGRYVWVITAVGLLASALGAGVSFLLPNTYRAEARLIAPRTSGLLGGAGLLSEPVGIGLNLAGAMNINQESRLFEHIIRSRTIADRTIDAFGLMGIYGLETHDAARWTFGKHLDVDITDGVIKVGFLDEDPGRAMRICSFITQELETVYARTLTSRARSRRKFLEKRLETIRTDLRLSEEELQSLKERSGAVEPTEQARVTLDVSGRILGEYYKQLVETRVLARAQSESSPALITARTRLEELESQLRQLDSGSPPAQAASSRTTAALPSSAILPLSRVPTIEVQIRRATRHLTILEKLFALITQEYEAARIEEVNDVKHLTLLDAPIVPETKHAPRRKMYVLAFGLIGTFLAFFSCYLHSWAENLALSDPATYLRISRQTGLLGSLFGFRGGEEKDGPEHRPASPLAPPEVEK